MWIKQVLHICIVPQVSLLLQKYAVPGSRVERSTQKKKSAFEVLLPELRRKEVMFINLMRLERHPVFWTASKQWNDRFKCTDCRQLVDWSNTIHQKRSELMKGSCLFHHNNCCSWMGCVTTSFSFAEPCTIRLSLVSLPLEFFKRKNLHSWWYLNIATVSRLASSYEITKLRERWEEEKGGNSGSKCYLHRKKNRANLLANPITHRYVSP